MMPYAFNQELLYSGDLRTFLAMSQPGSDRFKLFEALSKKDGLIRIGTGQPAVIGYDMEAVKRQDAWHQICASSSFLQDRFGKPLFIGGLYARGTCVLVGSGPSLDKEFIKSAAERGAVIITTGNACYLYPEAQIWIGAGDILGYLPIPFERNSTLAVVPKKYLDENLWDATSRRQANRKLREIVATAYYDVDTRSPEEILQKPGVSNFGVESTFTAALSLAVSLGFSNIILAGMDMGGTLEKYFAFDEIPHQDTFQRKTAVYTQIRTLFPQWNKALLNYALRVVAVDRSPFDIPVFPKDYMLDVLGTIMGLSRRLPVTKELRLSTPAEKKRMAIKTTARHSQAILSPMMVLDHLKELAAKAPDIFATPEMMKVQKDLQEQLAKGGCSGCTKNRIGRPVYEAFVKEVFSNSGKLDAVWSELFPQHYVLRTNDQFNPFRFRSDAVKEREEFEALQKA